ncbi:MAG: hypothetical protein ACXWTT_00920 [Methylobacter sp.]
MKNSNKPNMKTLVTTEAAKVAGKLIATDQSKNKTPIVDDKKPELTETEVVTAGNEPVNLIKETGDIDQLIPEAIKTESIPPEPKTSTTDVNKPESLETVVVTTGNEPAVSKPESDKPEQPKLPTKADKAKAIYDEMIKDPKNDRAMILAKIKKELVLTKAGAQTYFYKFQRESGVVTEKLPTKVEKAKVVYDKMTLEGQGRKEIIAAFIKDVGLTPAGASTYFQNLKKAATDPIISV